MKLKQGLRRLRNYAVYLRSFYANRRTKTNLSDITPEPSLKELSLQLSTFKLPDFVDNQLYKDGGLTTAFFDKLQVDGINETLTGAEALSIKIQRLKAVLESYIQHPDERLANIFLEEYGVSDIQRIYQKLKNDEVQLKILRGKIGDKPNKTLDREWFIGMCKNFSDMYQYRVRFEDLFVTEFVQYYHDLDKYIRAQKKANGR